MVNMLFYKVLGENEKYITYLKKCYEEVFGPA